MKDHTEWLFQCVTTEKFRRVCNAGLSYDLVMKMCREYPKLASSFADNCIMFDSNNLSNIIDNIYDGTTLTTVFSVSMVHYTSKVTPVFSEAVNLTALIAQDFWETYVAERLSDFMYSFSANIFPIQHGHSAYKTIMISFRQNDTENLKQVCNIVNDKHIPVLAPIGNNLLYHLYKYYELSEEFNNELLEKYGFA